VAERSPELAALAAEVAGREHALELARAEELPEFALSLSFTGSVEQSLGGMFTLPLRRDAINGAIDEAGALLAAAQAARLEHGRNLGGRRGARTWSCCATPSARPRSSATLLIPRAELLAHGAEAGVASGRAELDGALDARLELLERAPHAGAAPRRSAPRPWPRSSRPSDLDVDSLMHPRMGPSSGAVAGDG
jgi:hypothetical protein